MRIEDKTGRTRIAKNVGASYIGHIVFVVLGFVMPRMIDSNVGQVSLGVWDFSWSVVNYLNMMMVGIGSSVNRYVARFRAAGDTPALNRMISTVMAIQASIAGVVLVISIAIFFLIPDLLEERLQGKTDEAAIVVLLLGASLAVQMKFDAWRGVLTGCHRWGLYNGINAGGYALTAAAMIVALVRGYGIVEMAFVYLAFTFAIEIVRETIGRRVCPELQPKLTLVNLKDGRKAVNFGIRSIVLALPGFVVVQTISILIVSNLGPAALAILSRPLSLALQVNTLMNKYAFVLTPTAGSLQGQRSTHELHQFIVQNARNGWLFAVPPLAFLFVLGDQLIITWMGPDYGNWKLSAILSAGYLLSVSQNPVVRIMVGLNMHGRIGKISGLVAIFVLGTGIAIAELYGWSLLLAAGVIACSVGAGIGITVIVLAIRTLHLSIVEYFTHVVRDGLFLLIALIAILGVFRWQSDLDPLAMVLAGAALTGGVVLLVQWQDVKRIGRALQLSERQ